MCQLTKIFKVFIVFELFLTHKMLLSSQKSWVGSEIQDPGVKKHRILDPDMQQCFQFPGGKHVIWSRQKQDRVCGTREMENTSRGSTFGDFVTILTERSMQDVRVKGLG
jgi:hypothetical protein